MKTGSGKEYTSSVQLGPASAREGVSLIACLCFCLICIKFCDFFAHLRRFLNTLLIQAPILGTFGPDF